MQRRITIVFLVVHSKHFVGQALRREFLCGKDQFSGRSYEQRKQWIVDRMKQLSGVFAMDVCAYAIMTEHP
jgi:hypothetical protein